MGPLRALKIGSQVTSRCDVGLPSVNIMQRWTTKAPVETVAVGKKSSDRAPEVLKRGDRAEMIRIGEWVEDAREEGA